MSLNTHSFYFKTGNTNTGIHKENKYQAQRQLFYKSKKDKIL